MFLEDPNTPKKKSKHKSKDKIKEKVRDTKESSEKRDTTSASDGSVRLVQEAEVSELDRLREVLLGTLKNKYGSLAHSFAEMDVNQSAIVDADVRSG